MSGDVHADAAHGVDGQLTHVTIRLASGAMYFEGAAAKLAEEAFGHLAADAITGTENQNAIPYRLITIMAPPRRSRQREGRQPCVAGRSRAAGRRATRGLRCRFHGAQEGGDEFASNLRADGFRIEARGFKELARFLDAVYPGGFDLDGCESATGKLLAIFVFFERTSDAADPEFHAFANFGGQVAADQHIRYRQTSAGLKDAKRFGEDAVFVAGEIDDAVRNDHVDGVVGERDVFDRALEEFNILNTGLFLILAGQREHFVGQVQAIGFSGKADAFGGKNDVNAAPRAEIKHGFAGLQLSEGRGVTATERGRDGFFGQRAFFRIGVEVLGDEVAPTEFRAIAAAGGPAAGGALGGGAIFLLYGFLEVAFGHWSFSLRGHFKKTAEAWCAPTIEMGGPPVGRGARRSRCPACNLHDGVGGHGARARAAFFVKKSHHFAQSLGVRGVPEIGALPADIDEADLFQFFEMVGKGGSGDSEFFLDFAGDHAGGVGSEEEPENLETGLRAEGGKAVGRAGNQQRVGLAHYSIIAEIWKNVKPSAPPTFSR